MRLGGTVPIPITDLFVLSSQPKERWRGLFRSSPQPCADRDQSVQLSGYGPDGDAERSPECDADSDVNRKWLLGQIVLCGSLIQPHPPGYPRKDLNRSSRRLSLSFKRQSLGQATPNPHKCCLDEARLWYIVPTRPHGGSRHWGWPVFVK